MIVFPLYLRGWEQIVSYSGDGWHSSDFRLCEQVIAHNITPLYIYYASTLCIPLYIYIYIYTNYDDSTLLFTNKLIVHLVCPWDLPSSVGDTR